MAGLACAESNSAEAAVAPTTAQGLTLHEEEVADISLGSFYVVDKENPGGVRSPGEVQMAGWRCGWRCGCPRCRCAWRCGWRCGCARCGCA
jgi:hypothetical protein